jgi:DNA repair exonuclease SbcCD ATPase subunit
MPNRNLTAGKLEKAVALLDEIRLQLNRLARGDPALLFAYRRKIAKELSYDERSTPMFRRKLKAQKRKEQGGTCPLCRKPLPDKYAVLDRLRAADGYTPENTRLICAECDRRVQSERGYT